MPSSPIRVLILEPSTDLRVSMRVLLEDLGHNVMAASETAEALALVESRGLPDLVVTAARLPLRSGAEFLASLRAQPSYRWAPVFQILHPGDQHLSGVAGFLELPITLPKMLSMLNSVGAGEGALAPRAWRDAAGLVTLDG